MKVLMLCLCDLPSCLWSCLLSFVAPLISKTFPCIGCSCPGRGEVGLCVSGRPKMFSIEVKKKRRETSKETERKTEGMTNEL